MSSIYLVDRQGLLTELLERPYESEGLLQKLIASHPSVLAGDQVDAQSPRRWLLISRELSVPDDEDGSHRWRLDHLFLDQDAVPTLVEVKRSTDPRLRREVIGQMLDYAANGRAYWSVDNVKSQLYLRCEKDALDPDVELAELLGERDLDDFWKSLQANLDAGRIRLVFVADEIPREVRVIVEFLNEQMTHTEVLAIEIQNFVSEDGLRTLVPKVIGLTEKAVQQKAGSQRRAVSLEEFLASIPPNLRRAYDRLRGLMEPHLGKTLRERVYVKTTNYTRISDRKLLVWITVEPDMIRFGLPPDFVRDQSRVVGTTDAGNSIIAVRTDAETEVVVPWLEDRLRDALGMSPGMPGL